MASYYQYNNYQHSVPHNQSTLSPHATSRSRRAPRPSQNSQKQSYRSARKEEEPIIVTSFRQRFEAGRSFDLDDDLEFCPSLVTDIDMFSINSASSDRSSLSSESPGSSPQSHQVSPSTFHLNPSPTPYIPAPYRAQSSNIKSNQSGSGRTRNAILIVNPSSRIDSTPSPDRQPQPYGRPW
ncbi:unnamed protein product [Blumeria hordei]|uniref:Uncharacterized protein n=2 Tax=Blumeria hordei TaxID=2867405 RepID=A0A383V0M3_BLUHO|nr:hypothetical protein BGHDH14_bgh06242 [Blumeria hordei DH14]SZF05385.1 unnamed protein product [Blumeria hordei]